MKFPTVTHAYDFIDNVFLKAARIVEGDNYADVYNPVTKETRYVRAYKGREWFADLRRRYQLHPGVLRMMRIYKPDDWQQLLLEWPHRADSDANRIAYTRDERAGLADKQTVTSVGKYLHRHFSHAPDDMIRDIVAEYTYDGEIKIVRDIGIMVTAVTNGPASCMTKRFDILCDDNEYRHPYEVYDPDLGWGMAVRKDDNGYVLGRCLVFEHKAHGHKGFVRSYKRERGEHAHSGSDEAIESFLRNLGYDKWGEWPEGTPLMRYELRSGGGYLMPYIDGSTQRVDSSTFRITEDGDIDADNTDGRSDHHRTECSHCGERYNDEEEGGYVGRHEDTNVCQYCLDHNYVYAYGRRGNEYYIPDNDAIEVDGNYYDPEYLSDNNIVELHNGEYCDLDNAVYVESQDAYYNYDDDDICYTEDTNEYDLKSNCWQCEESNNWYTNDTDYVEIDGCVYHPDHAPETN